MELFAPGKRAILMRGQTWDYDGDYIVPMCKTYAVVGPKRYLRKLLRIGVEANNWGGPEKDVWTYQATGDIYQRLIWGYACQTTTKETFDERASVIYDLSEEFRDEEIEAIYNSLSWDGMDRASLDWFLRGLCSRHPNRCALAKKLTVKYIEDSPETGRHTH